MARQKLYTYTVNGNGPFPMDMLRYDSAWPARGEDAQEIQERGTSEGNRLNRNSHDGEQPPIMLRSYQQPTVARWASFLWGCGTVEVR